MLHVVEISPCLINSFTTIWYYVKKKCQTDLTDDLHNKFGFRTDYEIITEKNFKKICKQTKK
ncbi:hypothetical protein B5E91_11085 [Thomasclavelia spiroformis]|uniref:Uncharacterized protein n=1 Tax=Thomasclavelia spiroformis TaxID=29348 RepID=A0A1Y4QG33_9FIRM|nr:hypothetical protein B5E91_11085 [Thomasclavelia spiroformis]